MKFKLAYVKALNVLFPCNFSQFLNFTDDCKGPNNIYLNGACYYVETRLLSISEAIGNCQETLRNGRLFEPRDEATHNSVHAAAVAISSQDYWLGINDTLSEGQFQYISGGNLSFSNWEEGMYIIVLFIKSSQFKRKILQLCELHQMKFLIMYFVLKKVI